MTLWLLARAAGFVALIAASVTVAIGAAGTATRGDRRILTQLVHRSTAVVTLTMLGLHAALLVTDHYVDVSLGGAMVPFTAGYRGVALGLGTLSVYVFAVVSLTGALRGRMATSAAAARTWRAVHLSAYGAWVLAMGHGLLAGTDVTQPWGLAIYAICTSLVAGAVAARVAEAARERRTSLHHARSIRANRSSTTASTIGGTR